MGEVYQAKNTRLDRTVVIKEAPAHFAGGAKVLEALCELFPDAEVIAIMYGTGESMAVIISDDILRETGLSERDLRIEVACRLFDLGKLALWPSAKVAGLSRMEFEAELHRRRIPVYRPTLDELNPDLGALEQMGI
jgi:predicted HTH domain antitoxin